MVRAIPAPSLKTIRERLSLPNDKAKLLRGLMVGSINPEEFDSVKKWINKCQNRLIIKVNIPANNELIMCAINEILGGYGVEVVDTENSEKPEYIDSYYRYFVASYVNMGDTYDQTVMFDHLTGRFMICSWGDYVAKRI